MYQIVLLPFTVELVHVTQTELKQLKMVQPMDGVILHDFQITPIDNGLLCRII